MKKTNSAFTDLGFNNSEASALTFKSNIYSKILKIIQVKKISPRELEKLLNVPQPRVSELLNGKLSSTSLEKLMSYLDCLGITTSPVFKFKKTG